MPLRNFLNLVILTNLLGCTSSLSPLAVVPPGEMPSSYTVQPGDSLHSIAKRFGTTIQELANLNQLPPPYKIYPHQTLIIHPSCPNCKQVHRGTPLSPLPSAPPCQPPIHWQWPTTRSTRVIPSPKGLTLAGRGQPIYAAASGTVTRSENLMNGYLIIQHNQAFSSVYSNIQNGQVKTGDHVTSGQPIAQMGSSFDFAIQCGNKFLNPLDYLPQR